MGFLTQHRAGSPLVLPGGGHPASALGLQGHVGWGLHIGGLGVPRAPPMPSRGGRLAMLHCCPHPASTNVWGGVITPGLGAVWARPPPPHYRISGSDLCPQRFDGATGLLLDGVWLAGVIMSSCGLSS